MREVSVRQPAAGPWRRRTASGFVAGAISLGMRSALDEARGDPPAVVDVAADRFDPFAALEVHFDARGPDDTWVVVRPWLLPPR